MMIHSVLHKEGLRKKYESRTERETKGSTRCSFSIHVNELGIQG